MDIWVLVIFAVVYAGMIVGRLPWLALDRAGIALVGGVAVLVAKGWEPSEGVKAFDIPTLTLLFSLMIVSAQFRISGFYTWVTRRVGAARLSPALLLGLVIATSGLLAALLTNDVIALATAPLLIEMASLRGLNPVPFLLGLAAGTNVGSAATLVGNPQNILIGETLDLSFAGYLSYAAAPAALGMTTVWGVIARAYRGRWQLAAKLPEIEPVRFDLNETLKGMVALGVIVALFLWGAWPRDLVALGVAGVLMLDRRLESRRYLTLVDWQLLVLFAGLFVVNAAFRETGALTEATDWLARNRVDLHEPGWLFAAVAVLSNIVSNVPAVMLLLPFADHPVSGPGLALFSTLAGNLIIVSSIANIIVVDQAARLGVKVSWREHARVGIPITLATFVIAALWLWVRVGVF